MNTIVTVGTFDGVHRGHEAVIGTLRDEATRRHLEPLIVTFTNHPLEIVAPRRAPGRLTTPAGKMALLSRPGMQVEMDTFDREMCALSAREWMLRLRDTRGMQALVLGHDNTFGCDGRTMTHEQYHTLGRSLGIDIIDAPVLPGISSSAVRRAVAEGDVGEAMRMLGRPYSVSGQVIHGNALGRTIGFPTANIRPDGDIILPPNGVYAVCVDGTPDGRTYSGVLNIGTRPTVADTGTVSVECHIIGYSGDLYGSCLTVKFLRHIRPERRFGSVDQLRAAIASDIRETLTTMR